MASSSSPAGEDVLALLAHDDRGAGVLAHRQHAAGGDVGVLQQVERDEAVVRGGLRVVEDLGELGEVAGAQQVRDVVHRRFRQEPQSFRFHDQHVAAAEAFDPDRS